MPFRDEDHLEPLELTDAFKAVDVLDALRDAGCEPFSGFDKSALGGDGGGDDDGDGESVLAAFVKIGTEHMAELRLPKQAEALFLPGARPAVRVVEITDLMHPARWWGFLAANTFNECFSRRLK